MDFGVINRTSTLHRPSQTYCFIADAQSKSTRVAAAAADMHRYDLEFPQQIGF